MNKLPFPTGFNIIDSWTSLDDLNCTMNIIFYDPTYGTADINKLNPSYFKYYSAYNELSLLDPNILDLVYDDSSFYAYFSKNSNLPCSVANSNWQTISQYGISITPTTSRYAYLLDLEGNILTYIHEYQQYGISSADSRELLSINGFKIYTEYDQSIYLNKIRFTYQGFPASNRSFDGFLVVANNTQNIEWYSCVKLHLENRSRPSYYSGVNTLRSLFGYSLSTPTIEYLSDNQWSSIQEGSPIQLTIEFDEDGNLKQGFQDLFNIYKLVLNISNSNKIVSLSNNIKCVKDTVADWLTILSEDYLDLCHLTFSVSSNSGSQRLSNIIVKDPTDGSPSYESAILNIVVTQDASSELPVSLEYYTAVFGRTGTEFIIQENTNVRLYINKSGLHIGTSENWSMVDDYDYPIEIAKKEHINDLDVIQSFTPTITGTTNWVDCTYAINSDNTVLIAILPLSSIADGGSRDTLITIKDSNTTLLNILVYQSASGVLATYHLYGKQNIEDSWEFIETDVERASYEQIFFPAIGGVEERYYAVICTDTSKQLDIDTILINNSEGRPILTTTKEAIQDSSSISLITGGVITSGLKLCFKVTYTVTGFNNDWLKALDKFISLTYAENTSYDIMIALSSSSTGEHSYVPTEDESIIWKTFELNDLYVTCVDTGEGLNVDPISILYKGTTGNIYKTIESKDAKLFLGNYKTPELEIISEESGIQVFDSLLVNESHSFNYIGPSERESNILQYNSYDMRMLKKGESYLLGVIFVYKTGQKSSVHFLKNPNTTNGEFILLNLFYNGLLFSTACNELFYITMTKAALLALNDAGIAAVIPVRAINTSFKAIALGFSLPTMQIDSRTLDSKSILQYPYRYGNHLKDCQMNFKANPNDSTFPNIEFEDNTNIIVVNTPEMDCTEDLVIPQFTCKLHSESIPTTDFIQDNSRYCNSLLNVHLQIDSKYINSHQKDNLDTWYGFLDENDGSISEVAIDNNYGDFKIYVWNRDIVGGEWPAAKTKQKVFVYKGKTTLAGPVFSNTSMDATCYSYRNYDYVQLLNIGDTEIYQGNVDYTFHTDKAYNIEAYRGTWSPTTLKVKATTSSSFPYTLESGIDSSGNCYSPIWMRYKATPHLVVDLGNETLPNYSIVELYNEEDIVKDEAVKVSSLWIKCGPMVSTDIPIERPLRFMAGDWFYGNYECLRTYPYSNDDPNSVVEVFSGFLMSKVNLVCRADVNKGIAASYLSPTNFNIFNPVYNLEDNFFTYSYKSDNISYNRNFANTILWSLNKLYGSETDEWCHILNVNSLDLDGDKGNITSIEKFNGSLIAFLTSGISQILFNDNVQISAKDGTPIEIANSGTVNGKRYLLDRIGCLNRESIVNSTRYMYFIDSINKSIYTVNADLSITDICYTKGMKSWAIQNLNKNWWGYYDVYSQEVLFANNSNCIAYNDAYEYFPCFLSYGGIKNVVSLNGRTYLFNTDNYSTNSLWKKNAISENKIFGNKVPIEIEIIANPEPTEDKTFEVLEYRADSFSKYSENDLFSLQTKYNPLESFDSIRVSNEYQDTDTISLYSSADNTTYQTSKDTYKVLDEDTNKYNGYSTILKKFRIWRIQIPRASKTLSYSTEGYSISRDRIRNPWCKIQLSTSMKNSEKLIVHDFAVKYFK